jgi:hypothetical protein
MISVEFNELISFVDKKSIDLKLPTQVNTVIRQTKNVAAGRRRRLLRPPVSEFFPPVWPTV